MIFRPLAYNFVRFERAGKNGLNICIQQETSYQNYELFFLGFEKKKFYKSRPGLSQILSKLQHTFFSITANFIQKYISVRNASFHKYYRFAKS